MFENFNYLLDGFAAAFILSNLIYGFIGTFLGTLVVFYPA